MVNRTKGISSDETPLPTLLTDVAVIDTGSTPEQGPCHTKVPRSSEEKTAAAAASSVSDVLDQQSKRRAKASPVQNRSPERKKHAPKNGRAEYQSHQEHLIQSSDTQETMSLSSLSPGAIHVQRGKRPPPPDEWDNVTEHSDGGRDVSSDLVVTASLVPDEEDLAEQMEKRMEKKIQQAIVVEATSSNSLDRAKCRRYAFVIVIIVLAVIGTVTGVTLKVVNENDDPAIEVPKAHTNNICSAAYAIELGVGRIQGSIHAGPQPYLNHSCSSYHNATTGASWYSLVGDNNVYAFSTCSSDLTFDSDVSVFSGSCDTQECITVDYYNNDCNETVFSAGNAVFHALAGVEYFISIASMNKAMEGTFTLSMSPFELPSNNDCSAVAPFDPSVGIIQASIRYATSSPGPDDYCYKNSTWMNDWYYYMYDYNGFAPNVWYSLIGDDKVYLLSTCSSELNFATRITVSTGSCDALECVVWAVANDFDCDKTSSGAARVQFYAMAGVEYFISVENMNYTMEWEFSLSISNLASPSNDLCAAAEAIDPNIGPTHGRFNNATASLSSDHSCFVDHTWNNDWFYFMYDYNGFAPNVWYSLIGDDKVYLLSTCSSELNFATRITVSTGSCDALECVVWAVANDFDCDETSSVATRVLFRAMAGVEYFISVENMNKTMEGDFNLVVSPVMEPWNDVCQGALLIQPGDDPIYGSTYNATDSLVNISLGYQMYSDLWYRVEGTGTLLTASTCGVGTLFDTVLSVFEGIDGECDQSLIVSDDDFCAPGSQVQWFAETGSTYYIRVYGFDGMSGSFQFQVV